VHPDDELPAGWLTQFRRGLLSGAGLLLIAVVGCALPAFLVWLVPGVDTTPASSAVKSGALLALAAAHGGLLLNGEPVSLAPMLIAVLLGWLVVGQVRRAESTSSVVGLAAGYGLASWPLADWATLGATRASGSRSAVAGLLFVGLLGLLTRGGDWLWRRLPERRVRAGRAALGVLACYLAAGAVLAGGALIGHLSAAVDAQRQLAPGVSGLPVALLGMAATPNAVLAAVGYLTGPGFAVGAHTHVSVLSTSHGTLPRFPLLAAVPAGGPATALGLVLIAAVGLTAGWLTNRLTAPSGSWLVRLGDSALTAALAGGGLAALTALAGGGIGTGALATVGASWWAVGACGALVSLTGATLWLVVELARRRPSAEPAEAGTDATVARLRAVPPPAAGKDDRSGPRVGGGAAEGSEGTAASGASGALGASVAAARSRNAG
jgi:hypothetical protein